MSQTGFRTWFLMLSAGLTLAIPASARAQYEYFPGSNATNPGPNAPAYPPPGGYAPYGYGAPRGVGGALYGQAAVLDAYGNVGINMEQARVIREQANQAKLVTKKQTIDTMEYERAHKYWWTDEQVDDNAKRIQAAMNNPPLAEIASGRALNTLLPFIDKLIAQGKVGGTSPLDPEIFRNLNIAMGDDGGNASLLKDADSLDWPPALDGANQKKLDEQLKAATAEARKGKVPLATIAALNKQTDKLSEELREKYMKSEIDGPDYIDGKRFIERVKNATKALKMPNVSQVLAGASGAVGDTVYDLVGSMSSKGLTFARATPGHENDYVALHRAFVNFAMGAGASDTGFRVRINGTPGANAP